ncbi:MAG: hypothetical protein AAF709_07950 [Pseudomonadota bacterium]
MVQLSLSRSLALLVLVPLFAMAPSPTDAKTLPALTWRLENPFRLFQRSDHVEPHRQACMATFLRHPKAPILAAERWLSARYPRGWAEQIFMATCWHIWRQSYDDCSGLRAFVFPSHHRVVAEVQPAAASDRSCRWQIHITEDQIQYPRTLQLPCRSPASFDVPYPSGAVVSIRDETDGQELAVQRIAPRDVFIVGIGDSFASGDGNPDYPVNWRDDQVDNFGSILHRGHRLQLNNLPKRQDSTIHISRRQVRLPSAFWHNQACHRSLYSHQFRVALQLALEDPHWAATFVSLACSGAQIVRGLFLPDADVQEIPRRQLRSQIGAAAVIQFGGARHQIRSYVAACNIKGQIPELETLSLERCPRDRARRIDALLATIGGNDIGFAKLVADTVLIDRTLLRALARISDSVCTPRDARRDLASLRYRMYALRRAIHNHLPSLGTNRIALFSRNTRC